MVVKELCLSHQNHKKSATKRVQLCRVRRKHVGLASEQPESQHPRTLPETEAPSPSLRPPGTPPKFCQHSRDFPSRSVLRASRIRVPWAQADRS